MLNIQTNMIFWILLGLIVQNVPTQLPWWVFAIYYSVLMFLHVNGSLR